MRRCPPRRRQKSCPKALQPYAERARITAMIRRFMREAWAAYFASLDREFIDLCTNVEK